MCWAYYTSNSQRLYPITFVTHWNLIVMSFLIFWGHPSFSLSKVSIYSKSIDDIEHFSEKLTDSSNICL